MKPQNHSYSPPFLPHSHVLNTSEVLAMLRTSPEGLSSKEAEQRAHNYGENILPRRQRETVFPIAWRQFKNPFILILAIGALLAFVFNDALDGSVITLAMLLNAAIGFFQELKVSHILQKLEKIAQHSAIVWRDGRRHILNAYKLVPGDIISISQGAAVPADARLLHENHLTANEAVLTGESSPVTKRIGILKLDTPVANRSNMIYMGTTIEEGTAKAVVTATGVHSEFGKIAALVAKDDTQEKTPLQRQLNRLAKNLGGLFVAITGMLFIVGIATGREFLNMLLTAISVAVAAVPESLPVVMTVTLMVGAQRILQRGGLVKKIIAAETLGNTMIIAADKTATLTEGKLELHSLIDAHGRETKGEMLENLRPDTGDNPTDMLLLHTFFTANAFVENPDAPVKEQIIYGKPIDRAILRSLLRIGYEPEMLLAHFPRLDELPFNAWYRYSAVLNKLAESTNEVVLSVFGAPEVILANSTHALAKNKHAHIEVLSKERQETLLGLLDNYTAQGFKVLAMAIKKIPAGRHSIVRSDIAELTLLGFAAFFDPIRPDVEAAIKTAGQAGMRILMLTGDHRRTAEYVATQLGILRTPSRVIEGKELASEKLTEAVNGYDVFARVTPEDKQNIIAALKKNGASVAVIGDGVNDVPALINATIGIAVGSGTDAAKEAADLVLLSDSFAILIEAIRQGRIILQNIRKAIVYLISDAFSEISLIALSVFSGLPLALLPGQILWVNIIEDGLPAIALVFEKGEKHLMRRPPEKHQRLLSRPLKLLILFFGIITNLTLMLLFYWSLRKSGNVDYARTMTFVGLGITSLFYVFSVKSLTVPLWKENLWDNKILLLSVILGLSLYGIALYIGPIQNILHTVSLSSFDWLILTGLVVLNIAVIEFGKWKFLAPKQHRS